MSIYRFCKLLSITYYKYSYMVQFVSIHISEKIRNDIYNKKITICFWICYPYRKSNKDNQMHERQKYNYRDAPIDIYCTITTSNKKIGYIVNYKSHTLLYNVLIIFFQKFFLVNYIFFYFTRLVNTPTALQLVYGDLYISRRQSTGSNTDNIN